MWNIVPLLLGTDFESYPMRSFNRIAVAHYTFEYKFPQR